MAAIARKICIALFLIAASGFVAWSALEYWDNRRVVKTALNLQSLPGSVSAVECIDFGWSDVLFKCRFSINPNDIETLVSGREFHEAPMSKKTEELKDGPLLGREFMIDTRYQVWPDSFKNGGAVTLYTDKAKEQVLLSVYIE